MRRLALLLLLALATSCATAPETRTIQHKDLIVDGEKRLSEDVVPTAYALNLQVDPAKETFTGTVTIDIAVAKPTTVIFLHAEDITVSETTLTTEEGIKIGATAVPGANGGLAITLDQVLPAVGATLVLNYEGTLAEAPTGLYRAKDGDAWYAFTQFEPLSARQAFPSFDEPRFKTPFTSTVTVPKGQIAVSNGPEVKRTESETGTTFEFAPTKPLPTYLVAYGVGNFDVIEAPEGAIPGVPFRIITTAGKGKYTSFMLERTPKLVELLLEYFGGEFPYAKLDLLAVPNFSAGAMENVGLVTFRENFLLLDNDTASVRDRRGSLSITAHELAHMWFGNLVTMPWWNDLWLNESFATWMAARILYAVAPQLESNIDDVKRMHSVMESDGLENARSIRQPIKNSGDIYNAFDGITYGKGAAVINMIETWIGAEALQKGVQAYLKDHAHGSGSTEDFLSAVDAASGKPVTAVFRSFLDQAGAPLLEAELTCEGTPSVAISQTRYFNGNGKGGDQSWELPVCIRYEVKGKSEVHCDVVKAAKAAVELPATSCPKWIYPNADEMGYYRWKVKDDAFTKLATKYREALSPRERLGLMGNLRAMARTRTVPARTYLGAVDAFLTETQRPIVEGVIGSLNQLDRYVPEESRTKWNKKTAKLTQKKARKLGFKNVKGEPAADTMLRSSILMANARLAEDPQTIAAARKTVDTFLGDMDSVSTDMLGVALPIAAWSGDADLWLKYKMAIAQAPPGARRPLLNGLGSFRDPMLQRKSLDLILDGTLRSQDMWGVIGPSFRREDTFAVTWTWFTENYDKIVELVGKKSAGGLPWVTTGFCTSAGKKQAEAFFADPAKQAPGAERNLKNAMEAVDICIREESYIRPGLLEYLK